MDLKEAIYTRRSVRRYTDEPVSRETIEALLEAAVQAPTACNNQPWAFGVVTGTDAVAELGDKAKAFVLAKMPADSRFRPMLSSPDFHLFYGAPAVVCIYGKPGGDPIDLSLAAQNLMLTAHAAGLGTCWIGFAYEYLNDPATRAAYGAPADYRLCGAIALGHPAKAMPTVKKKAPEILYWK